MTGTPMMEPISVVCPVQMKTNYQQVKRILSSMSCLI